MTATPLRTASAAAAAQTTCAEEGFRIGWDHANRGVLPPDEHLHPRSPVRQGWQAGRECFGGRTLNADEHVRQWLQLRLQAWRHGRALDAAQVSAAFLRRIDVGHCPVTREALGRGTNAASDASIDRVDHDAGYAVGNLVVISRRAHAAKGELGFEAAWAAAHRSDNGVPPADDSLSAEQWARAAVLCSFATALPHRTACRLPLLVLPPPRLHVLNPAQTLQVMLSLQVTRDGHASRCASLAAHVPGAEARHAFNTFMHTLLARRLALGRFADGGAERHAVEDLWRDVLLNERWQRLALRLTAADCEALVRGSVERGLAGRSLRWLPPDTAAEGRALRMRGSAMPLRRASARHAADSSTERDQPAVFSFRTGGGVNASSATAATANA